MFTKEQLEKMIDESEFLGSGVARSSFAISENVVLKVSSYPWGDDQSETECTFYDEWYDQFSDLLPKMYGHLWYEDKWYLFMERVIPIYWYEDGYDSFYDYIEDNYSLEESERLIDRFTLFEGLTGICDSSENEGNWGLRDGYPVLLDCGLTCSSRSIYDCH